MLAQSVLGYKLSTLNGTLVWWQWSPTPRAFFLTPAASASRHPSVHVPHAQAFSETDKGISRVVVLASVIMALVLLVLGCATACIARVVAGGIVEPVNQLIDVVLALNKLDFSRQVRKRRFCSLNPQFLSRGNLSMIRRIFYAPPLFTTF